MTGDLKARCSATAKSTGERCTQPSAPGATVCRYHGGAAPQVQAAAARRLLARAVEGDAAAVLAHEGVTGVDDPIGELSLLAAALREQVSALGKRVNALDNIRYQSGQGEQIRAEVQLLGSAQDRFIRILDTLAKHDLEGRKQTAKERFLREIVALVQQLLDGLELSRAQWSRVPSVMGRVLGAQLADVLVAPAVQLVELEEGSDS